MPKGLPAVYVTCPKSDHDWQGRPRAWSDENDLFSMPCPSCGWIIRFRVHEGKLAPLPGWVNVVRNDHELTLAGRPAGAYDDRVGSRAPAGSR